MQFFNTKNSNRTERTEEQALLEMIAPAALKIYPNYIQVGESLARTLFIFQYPRYLTTNWFTPIITLDKELDISLFFHPADTTVILSTLRKKTGQIQSQISEGREKGKVRDPLLETALQDVEGLRDTLQQGQEKFYKFGLYITIYGKTPKDLDSTENEIRSMLETRMVFSKPALYEQNVGFISTLPIGMDKLNVGSGMNSLPLASIFPFVSTSLTSNKGIMYGVNRHNNSLILFDRFSMENANMVVFAKSGSGKSYTVKLECLRSLMLGTDIIIIDPENEYRYLAETTGGSFIKISLSSPHHLNPFDLPIVPKDESPADVFRSNVVSIVGLLRIMLGGLTPEEDAILDKAIIETYASRDITPNSDFSKAIAPTLGDLQMILSNMEGAKQISVRLEKFAKGSYSTFFNQPSNVELRNCLVVFSIRDMEEELRPIAMYIILHYIWNIIRSELKKRILVVDEAWWMMQHPDGASFLFGTAKRARKYYLGVTTITQDIPDFMSSPYGKPIVTNSSMQILLKQSPATIDVVAKTFNLTQEERYLLLEASVGEGLFFAGQQHVAIKVLASYSEDQIITSDPKQLLEIEQAKEEWDKAHESHL
ncbi:MAG: conjugal transfer protein TraC [Candidatus Portnoybacteria bacterium CG10_big_fil_rev_8_21_14_0_10_36_7]|uniref:Conjugal transfer protein TraC n=1 Tax=Candidatus Portnoybacteria bacterium CG10_big_fil_rev_8_21_14_0_10_36_7 TaxID=1974812 RepID=A0A2M8KEJ3_9BACT|nr:MAG: conjugal transfer protein TraC [Candidatus Portnoybacteria bacterium CG10_big_fil_rev_8_21_14_0_10_36_7]